MPKQISITYFDFEMTHDTSIGWSGHLPAPFVPKKIGRYLFDRIRDLDTIEKYLETAYSNRSAFGEDLVSLYNIKSIE